MKLEPCPTHQKYELLCIACSLYRSQQIAKTTLPPMEEENLWEKTTIVYSEMDHDCLRVLNEKDEYIRLQQSYEQYRNNQLDN